MDKNKVNNILMERSNTNYNNYIRTIQKRYKHIEDMRRMEVCWSSSDEAYPSYDDTISHGNVTQLPQRTSYLGDFQLLKGPHFELTIKIFSNNIYIY